MALGDIAVGVTVGAAFTSAYRRVFQDARTRVKELGAAYEESNKRLTAAGAVLKYKRQLEDLSRKQGKLSKAEKEALGEARARFEAAKKAAQAYGIEVGEAAEKHKKLTTAVGRMQREMRARQRMERAQGGLGVMRNRLLGVAVVDRQDEPLPGSPHTRG